MDEKNAGTLGHGERERRKFARLDGIMVVTLRIRGNVMPEHFRSHEK